MEGLRWLRVAHELGHVLGFDSHASGTVMGDAGDRTTFLSGVQCQRARSYVRDNYTFVSLGQGD